jgi:hypothetical protein
MPSTLPALLPHPLQAPRPAHPGIPLPRAIQRAAQTIDPLAAGRIFRSAALMLGLLLLNMGGNPGAAVFFGILTIMVFVSPAMAFKALGIMWLGLMANQAFVPKSLTWTPMRLVLPYLCLARFAFDLLTSKSRVSLIRQPFYLVFLGYCAVMALCSVMSGWYTTIALFKLLNFWAAFTAIFAGAFILISRKIDIGEWVVSLVATAAGLGLLSVVTGEHYNVYKYGLQVKLFNGAFLHPNSHASYGSLFIIFLVCVYTFSTYRRRWLVLPLLATWGMFVLWSQSRTSITATMLGLVSLFIMTGPATRLQGWIRRSHLSRAHFALLGVLALIGLLVGEVVSQGRVTAAVVGFINKKEVTDPSQGFDPTSILTSRIGLINAGLENFYENPIFGIGFQVAKTEYFVQNATIFTAPAEKGFLPTAILEEGGVLGTTAFLVFIGMLLGTFLWQRNVPALTAFATFMGSTMTEVSIFSPGGSGGFCWWMVAAAWVFGELCWQPRAQAVARSSHGRLDAARPGVGRLPPLLPGFPVAG